METELQVQGDIPKLDEEKDVKINGEKDKCLQSMEEEDEIEDEEKWDSNDDDWEDLSEGNSIPEDDRVNNPASCDPRLMAAYFRRALRKSENLELPESVKVLHGNSGEVLYLIGTAHFSKKSCEEVEKVIQMVQPDYVVLELCPARAHILTMDEEYFLNEAKRSKFDKFKEFYQQRGLLSSFVLLLMHEVSDSITKQLGMAPGGEFRSAEKEASKISGCGIFLGDRPIEITMKRIIASLSFLDKLKFGVSLLQDIKPLTAEDVEKLKEKDMLEQLLEELMSQFPHLLNAILSERDIFLTKKLQKVLQLPVQLPGGGLVPPVAVGVVGLAHSAGIEKLFHTEISDQQMEEVQKIPPPSKLGKGFKFVTKGVLLGAVVYGMWGFVTWSGLYDQLVYYLPVQY